MRIAVTPFDKSAWARVTEELARDAWYIARLLAGEMPEDIEDAFASVGLSRMRELGMRGWAATSSGNAGAALAAYGARAGMRGTLFTLETAPRAKLTQILAYGPRVLAIRGLGYDPEVERRTFQTVRGLCEANDWAMQITAQTSIRSA